jgi:DNA-binding HxlR family transcriptional regulator
MATRRNYNQNCPIAKGLDVLGERWTLLILRELVGGARRYSDLRAELPGIATNLLADRLRALEEDGLIDRADMPPPAARTVFTLSDEGWRRVLPVLQAIAGFGIECLDVSDPDVGSPLNGFLAGILLGFDPVRADDLDASYRVEIDGRRFEFGVSGQRLTARGDAPTVTVTAAAADLLTARLASTAAQRDAALLRVCFTGEPNAIDTLRNTFGLVADPVPPVGERTPPTGVDSGR